MLRRLSLLWLVALALLLPLLPAKAADTASRPVTVYVALGDSVASGFRPGGAPNHTDGCYVNLFANYIRWREGNVELRNLAVDGLMQPPIGETSTSLRWKLTDPQDTAGVQAALRGAKVVTISIGGNNLLPAVAAIASGDLAGATAYAGQGVAAFGQDWPRILAAVRALSPNAKLFVNTVYNPFIATPYDLNGLTDSLIRKINAQITRSDYRTLYHYKVADVYSQFRANYWGVPNSFLLTYIASPLQDIHPNDNGHVVIASLLMFQYP